MAAALSATKAFTGLATGGAPRWTTSRLRCRRARLTPGAAPRGPADAIVGETEMTVSVGERAPDFTLRDATGRGEVKLSDFAGRAVVLAFYVLAFTGG
ncbi:MAG: hypothetical protein C4290_12040 [Chloroflexota bacterium]